MKRSGLTLVELLVVIAIIAILASFLFPTFIATRERARVAVCQSNLKQIGGAFHIYMSDWDETYPLPYTDRYPGDTAMMQDPPFWKDRLIPYLKTRDVYRCPSNDATARFTDYWVKNGGAPPEMKNVAPVSYAMNDTAFQSNQFIDLRDGSEWIGRSSGPLTLSDIERPGATILILESQNPSSALAMTDIMWASSPPDSMPEEEKGYLPPYGNSLFVHDNRHARSNWLFCDGSVRSLRLIQTLQGDMMWFATLPHNDAERYDQNYFLKRTLDSLPLNWK